MFLAVFGLGARDPSSGALDRCETLLAERPHEKSTAECFYDLTRRPGGSPAARRRIEEIAKRSPDLPWFTYYGANLHWTETSVADGLYSRAIETFQEQGSVEGEVKARLNRGKLLFRVNQNTQARSEMDRALELTRGSDDPELRAWGEITVARQLVQQGQDLEAALRILHSMEVSPSDEQLFSLRRERLILLENVYLKLGRTERVLEVSRKLVEMAVEAQDTFLEANARYDLALAAYEEAREMPTASSRDKALELAQRTLEVARAADHRSVEAQAAWIVGVLTPGREGRRFLERCVRAAESADLVSYCINPLAGRQARSDPRKAEATLARSLELARQSNDGWAEARVWQESLRLSWLVGSPEEALSASWSALDKIESLRDRQPVGSPAQAGAFSVWADDYSWLSGRILREAGQGLQEERAFREALKVGERKRARALTDWLRRTDQQSALEEEWTDFVELGEARDALAPDEVLLSFQVAPWKDLTGDFGGGSWLLAITRGGVSVHRLPGRVEVRRAVRLFEGLITGRDGKVAEVAAKLYQDLLAPALAELPPEVDRLILVPDDALHRLPFAALRAAPEAEPLGARYELVRAPSATLWLRWRAQRTAPPERPLLVLADPDLPELDEDEAAGAVGSAGDPQVAELGSPAAFRGESLGRLRHARREGEAAVRALGGGRLLVGPEASEAAFVAAGPGDFGLIHFAAHAVTDEDRPERSAVLLAAGEPRTSEDGDGRSGQREGAGHAATDGPGAPRGGEAPEGSPIDGRLEAAEIAHLDLDGRTVVLASCRSADGTVLRGEGVMSLARAFFQAGSHGVVASLWPLRDDESAALFGRFYELLADGATVSEALHGARRAAIEAGAPAAAWAGVVVLGEGRAVPVPKAAVGVPWWIPAGAAAVLVVLVVAAVLVRRRSAP